MSEGYRWLSVTGQVAGPRHRSVATAARWLARQPRRPRVERPAPSALVAERTTTVTKRARRRPLTAGEREQLLAAVIATPPRTEAPRRWLRRQAEIAQQRRRRRASLPRLTSRLAS